jgi:hypothetical protein
MKAVARVLQSRIQAAERGFYRTYLLYGGPHDRTGGLQRQMAALLERTLAVPDFTWSLATIAGLAKEARTNSMAELADRLERIATAESVLAPMSLLFSHLLGMDGKSSDDVVGRLRNEWGSEVATVDLDAFQRLPAEIGADTPEVGDRWLDIATAFRHHRVHIEDCGDEYELSAFVVRQAVVNRSVDLPSRIWSRNASTPLVGFRIDRHGRLVGEARVPKTGLSAAEFQL